MKDDAQEESHGRADRGGIAAGEAGARVAEICRKVGISQATYYLWKRQYSGVGVSELRELRQLREENGRLKRIIADLSMDRSPAGDGSKKALRPRARPSWRAGPGGLPNQ